jgi:hypothetical protein
MPIICETCLWSYGTDSYKDCGRCKYFVGWHEYHKDWDGWLVPMRYAMRSIASLPDPSNNVPFSLKRLKAVKLCLEAGDDYKLYCLAVKAVSKRLNISVEDAEKMLDAFLKGERK